MQYLRTLLNSDQLPSIKDYKKTKKTFFRAFIETKGGSAREIKNVLYIERGIIYSESHIRNTLNTIGKELKCLRKKTSTN